MRIVAATLLVLGVWSPTGALYEPAGASVAKPDSIEFQSLRDGNGYRDYVVRADGTGLQQLPTDVGTWAPNGTGLARVDRNGTARDLTVVSADGRVHHLATGGHVRSFDWSPDGKKIVYDDDRDAQPMTIVVVASGRRLALPPGSSPRWAPDGKHISFLRPGTSPLNTLWVIDSDGSHRRLLSDSVAQAPRWAPNGKRLAYEVRNVRTRRDDLWAVDADGSRDTKIAAGEIEMSWSFDSKRLVYTRHDGEGLDGGFVFSVFVGNADGSATRRILGGADPRPVWSPARDEIALVDGSKNWEGLFVVRPDGHGLRRLLAGDTYDVAWSADGRLLAAAGGAPEDVWVLDVAAHTRRRISEGWRYGYDNESPRFLPRGIPSSLLRGTPVPWSLPTDSVVTPQLLEARRPIEYLDADGSTVAVGYGFGGYDDDIRPVGWCLETWNRSSGALTRYAQSDCTRPSSCCSLGAQGMGDFSFAGDRLTWVRLDHFAGRDLIGLGSATAGTPKPRTVAFCDSGCVFDVEGKGQLAVYDSWVESCASPSYPEPCAFAPRKNDTLYRIDGDGTARISSSTGALAPLSVDAGRILVDHENGTLELMSAGGATLQTFHVYIGDFLGAKLEGNDVVVLKQTTIADYDAASGMLMHEWPLSAGDRTLVDVQDGIALYVTGTAVHLFRLADGREAVIQAPGKGRVLAQLEPGGLFYSYTADDPKYPGRVVFVPHDQLPIS